MKEATFHLGKDSFKRWRKENTDVERLIITGEGTMVQAYEIAENFDYESYKEIVFEQISVLPYRRDSCNNPVESEVLSQLYHEDDYTPPVFYKLLLNLQRSNIFKVRNQRILCDNSTLIHVPSSNNYTIDSGIVSIGNYAFSGYTNLKNVRFNEGLKEIGEYAFTYTGIMKVEMPDTIISIGEGAFYGTDELESVVLSKNLKAIPYECFAYSSLIEIEIPSSVKEIGYEAFFCNTLGDVRIPEGVETIEFNAFTYLNSIKLPASLRKIDSDFYYEMGIMEPDQPPYIEVSPGNPTFYSKDGTLYFRATNKCALDSKYMG